MCFNIEKYIPFDGRWNRVYSIFFYAVVHKQILKVCVAQGLDCTLNELWSKGKGRIFTFFFSE